MKLNDELVLRKIGSNYMIVKSAGDNVSLTDVIRLNETAAALWREFSGRDFSPEDMVASLCSTYEVSEAVATRDVHNLLKQWKEYGMLSAAC